MFRGKAHKHDFTIDRRLRQLTMELERIEDTCFEWSSAVYIGRAMYVPVLATPRCSEMVIRQQFFIRIGVMSFISNVRTALLIPIQTFRHNEPKDRSESAVYCTG
jgi:hypothetical protein